MSAIADAGRVWGDAGTLAWRWSGICPGRSAARRGGCSRACRPKGIEGAYDSVQRLVRRWKVAQSGRPIGRAFVPLVFAPGEVCQFDWSHETVELNGVMQTVKVAHFRLACSRQTFVVAYPRETQEMVFDAHDRAFAFFGGVPLRMVYDNLKGGGGDDLQRQGPAVQSPLSSAGQPLSVRTRGLAPRPVRVGEGAGREPGGQHPGMAVHAGSPRFADLDALNAWLVLRCRELAQRKHPATPARSIAECFAARTAGVAADYRAVRRVCGAHAARLQHLPGDVWTVTVTACRLSSQAAWSRHAAPPPRCASWRMAS